MKLTKLTEYALLEINSDGDCVDRNEYGKASEAVDELESRRRGLPDGDIVALAVEKLWRKHRIVDGEELDREETILRVGGDREALVVGGWIIPDGEPATLRY